jgi:hypothetical protein
MPQYNAFPIVNAKGSTSPFASATPGQTTPQSSADRWAQIYTNVKDFGAQGDGVTDDTLAIRAAIAHTSGANRGEIFFPEGSYFVSNLGGADGTPAIPFNHVGAHSIIFKGVGRGSFIWGDFNGIIFDRHVDDPLLPGNESCDVFEHLNIHNFSNGALSGAIRWNGVSGLTIHRNIISGKRAIQCFTDAFGVTIRENEIGNGSGQYDPASIGIMFWGGGGGVIQMNDIAGHGNGIRLGSGCCVFGNRLEMNGVGVNVGIDQNGGSIAVGSAIILGNSFEANSIGVYGQSMNNSIVQASMLGDPFTNPMGTVSVTSITRSGSVATVTLPENHGFANGVEFGVILSGQDPVDYAGEYIATATGANTFTYTVAGSPTTPATTPGLCSVPSQYGLWMHNGAGNVFWVTVTGHHYGACIFCDSNQEHNKFEVCFPQNDFGPGALWSLPANTAGFDFDNCHSVPAHEITLAEAQAQNLPQNTIRAISNSNVTSGAITGTGANHVMAMRNTAGTWIALGPGT